MTPPLQQELLGLLLEAGEETVPTLFNTVLVRHPELSREAVADEVGEAMAALEQQAYVALSWYRDRWVDLTPEEHQRQVPLALGLRWNDALERWVWDEVRRGPDVPIAVLTPQGEAFARRSLPQT
jgi:hypothetical protein